MSEFEYYQAVYLAYPGIPDAAMDFIYLVFAYVVASYLAGNKLPRLIAVGASFVFTLSLIGPLTGVLVGIGQVFEITSQYQLAFPEGKLFQISVNSSFSHFVIVTPLVVGWLASILFLHLYVRGNRVEAGNKHS